MVAEKNKLIKAGIEITETLIEHLILPPIKCFNGQKFQRLKFVIVLTFSVSLSKLSLSLYVQRKTAGLLPQIDTWNFTLIRRIYLNSGKLMLNCCISPFNFDKIWGFANLSKSCQTQLPLSISQRSRRLNWEKFNPSHYCQAEVPPSGLPHPDLARARVRVGGGKN